MALTDLLARLERQTDTPDTPCNPGEVSAKPAPILACTLDTSETPPNIKGGGIEWDADWSAGAPPPSFKIEDVAELDCLIVRLCELEPWLADAVPEMMEARRRMAPVNLAESLTLFRGYVRDAEAAQGP